MTLTSCSRWQQLVLVLSFLGSGLKKADYARWRWCVPRDRVASRIGATPVVVNDMRVAPQIADEGLILIPHGVILFEQRDGQRDVVVPLPPIVKLHRG